MPGSRTTPAEGKLALGRPSVLLAFSVRHIGFKVACVLAAVGCGTDVVGVAECRAFERVRCEAAVACGYPDVAECKRFARDHCLHGVPLESINAIELDACALDVERAGRCAAAQGPSTLTSGCAEPVPTDSPRSACEVVSSPEVANSCAFLSPGRVPAPGPSRGLSDGGT